MSTSKTAIAKWGVVPAHDARMNLAGILPWANMHNKVWRKRVPAELLEAIVAWRPHQSLVILGPTGVSKTCAMVALLRRWDHRVGSADGYFITAYDLGLEARCTPLNSGTPPHSLRARSSAVCVIDMLGHEGAECSELIHEIAYARALAGLSTIWTSHLTEAGIAERYSPELLKWMTEGLTETWSGSVVNLHPAVPPTTEDEIARFKRESDSLRQDLAEEKAREATEPHPSGAA